MSDWAHKAFSPDTYSCSLCSITHHNFGMKKQWKQFISNEPHDFAFMYKDEYLEKHPNQTNIDFPAIIIENKNTENVLLSSSEISNTKNLTKLISKIKSKISLCEI